MALARRNTRPFGSDLAEYANAFGDADRMFNQLGSLLGSSQALGGYPVDLYETSDSVVLEMAVPGIRADDLDISVEGRQLSVRGKYPEFEGDERRYWLRNIPRGEFSRTVNLPTAIEVERVEARITDGLLTLTMPKVAEAKARKITINNG